MKKIPKQILLAIFSIAIAIPQGVFANSLVSDLSLHETSLAKVVINSVSNKFSSKVVVSDSTKSQAAVAEPSIYSCQNYRLSSGKIYSPQNAGSINFNQPSDCFNLTFNAADKITEPLSVALLPVVSIKVVVLRTELFKSARPAAPVTDQAGVLPLTALALLVLSFSFVMNILAAAASKLYKFNGLSLSIFRLCIIRC